MLTVEGLSKGYAGRGGGVQAVREVSVSIGEGQFLALLGPSGCGKTTTLRCVAGLERVDAGTIRIAGRVGADAERGVHAAAHERAIGMVFQSYAIWPHLDVFGNVAYPLTVRRPRPSGAEIERLVAETLDLVGMSAMARRPSTALSGGQQQRVALARAIVARPTLLLLDEPLSNLDPTLRDQMQQELADLVRRVQITTLYVTHDQAEALAMADRVAVMADGRIVQVGSPREVFRRPCDRFVASFLGRASFIRGTVRVRRGDEAGLVEVGQQGDRLAVRMPAGMAVGDEVDVALRPEDLVLWIEPPRDVDGAVRGTVVGVGFQGGRSECRVRVGEATVRVLHDSAIETRIGQPVWLTSEADRGLAFARNDESR